MDIICIAGKGWVACNALRYLIETLHFESSKIKIIPTKSDDGTPSWQPSLRRTAENLSVECLELKDVYDHNDLKFISLEFDQIIHVNRFKSDKLYNIHFSRLPAYRGIGMAMLPLLYGETSTAVTLHEIDAGIDTGPIIAQHEFCIEENWTCRDLYFEFHKRAFNLFKEYIGQIIGGTLPKSIVQSFIGASYYGKKDVMYGDALLNLTGTAWQAHNSIRAAIFWEYQLPMISGRKCVKSTITNRRSIYSPGTTVEVDKYNLLLSTTDYDVALKCSPYEELYKWATEGNAAPPFEMWKEIDDIDFRSQQGWTASMMAAYNNNFEVLKFLLDQGASVNSTNYKGTSLLMYAKDGAILANDLSIVNLLINRGANMLCKDYKGMSIFDYLENDSRPFSKEVLQFLEEKTK